MHSMSNQFFKEIATIIIDFFKENRINKGDRYYLQLDTVDDVLQLVEALKNNNTEIKPFKYKHERGDEYKTFAITFDEIDLVVAYTSENVKPDFLVTLRNLVGEATR